MLGGFIKRNKKLRGDMSVLGIVTFLTFLISVPIIIGGLWLAFNSDCIKFLHVPTIIVGLALMAISLMGLLGVCSRQTFLLRLYLLGMFFAVTALLFLVIFAVAVTDYRGDGQVVMNRRFLEYQLSDDRGWLHDRVVDNWDSISACLRDGPNYAGMKTSARDPNTGKPVDETAEMFYTRKLTAIQSGCLKPPTSCAFTYVNETYWMPNPEITSSNNPDCSRWSNDQRELCFQCDSCKAGALSGVKKSWRKVAILNTVSFILLVGTFVAGCTVFRNAK
ncbi:unnamed protein product [Urochloa humidicola]